MNNAVVYDSIYLRVYMGKVKKGVSTATYVVVNVGRIFIYTQKKNNRNA